MAIFSPESSPLERVGLAIGIIVLVVVVLCAVYWLYTLALERFLAYYSAVRIVRGTVREPIILFDGVCNLCAWAVRFIIERDPKGYFHFAPLQSDVGRSLLVEHEIDPANTDSFVLVENGLACTESTAALRVARKLSLPWPAFYAGIILPPFVRDPIYRFIARNRYRWFGKQDSCMIPTPELRARFVE
jgi:predicted DCC family thiol-disulfide oxidoreductase YuxK